MIEIEEPSKGQQRRKGRKNERATKTNCKQKEKREKKTQNYYIEFFQVVVLIAEIAIVRIFV